MIEILDMSKKCRLGERIDLMVHVYYDGLMVIEYLGLS